MSFLELQKSGSDEANTTKPISPETLQAQIKDSLLEGQGFSEAQKKYIVSNIYPLLSKALVHFVAEAKRCDQIEESELVGQGQGKSALEQASNQQSENPSADPSPIIIEEVPDSYREVVEKNSAKIEAQSPIKPQRQADAGKKSATVKTRPSLDNYGKSRFGSNISALASQGGVRANTAASGKRKGAGVKQSLHSSGTKSNKFSAYQQSSQSSLGGIREPNSCKTPKVSKIDRNLIGTIASTDTSRKGQSKFVNRIGQSVLESKNAAGAKSVSSTKNTRRPILASSSAPGSAMGKKHPKKGGANQDQVRKSAPVQDLKSATQQLQQEEKKEQPFDVAQQAQEETKSPSEDQQPAKVMNYGGFGQSSGSAFGKSDNEGPAPKQMNYGGFGGGRARAQGPTATPKDDGASPNMQKSNSQFSGFQMPSANQSQSFLKRQFNATEQFKQSLNEVLTCTGTDRLYRNAMPGKNIPNQEYLKQKRGSVFHKAFECGSQAAKFVPPVHEKQDEDTQKLVDLFKNSFLTKNIDEKEHNTLANAMFQKKFKAGETIIRYGDIGSEYYVLANGTVSVTVYQPGTNPFDPKIEEKVSFKKELKAEASKGASQGGMIGFGEIALLYNDKRTASVTAVTECETWVLTGECFKNIIAQHSIRRRNISLEFLNKVELFNVLEQYEKVKLIDGLKVSQCAKGEYVFHEGDRGDHFYIIEEGEVECGNESEAGEFSHVRTLSAGSHFGEIAIIKGVRRTLSVRVSNDRVKLLVLTRDTFNRILGSIKAYLKEDYKKEHELDSSFTSDHSGTHAHAVKAKEDQSLFKIQEEADESVPSVNATQDGKAKQ